MNRPGARTNATGGRAPLPGRAAAGRLAVMEASPRRILVVADLTPATPHLLDLVRDRAAQGPTDFVLLVPDVGHPETPDWTTEEATRLLERSARRPVQARPGGADAFAAVEQCLGEQPVDEIIVSTLPQRRAHWLHHDLPSRLRGLGVPVVEVAGVEREPDARPGFGGISLP
jgi:hypothetical protein